MKFVLSKCVKIVALDVKTCVMMFIIAELAGKL